MEPLRRQHNTQWYHETQSSVYSGNLLEPGAATIRDRFLQGFGALADETLNAALTTRAGVFDASLACYHRLFPKRVVLSRKVTLSLYDRLSTALTVAQVTGIQPLCSHYAARLAPLDSPEASRKSNIRLAQITQYARQLATHPTQITPQALQQLVDVELSTEDIVTFSQIIGFVSYQARVIAGIAALAGRPAVVVPGFPVVDDAEALGAAEQPQVWQARLPEITLATAAAEQLDVLDQSHPEARNDAYYRLLAHDAAALRERNGVFNQINAGDYGLPAELKALAALVVSRINGSAYCVASLIPQVADATLTHALLESVNTAQSTAEPLAQAVIATAAELTRSPEKFTPQSVQPLFNIGLSQAQVLEVILSSALYGWENRLRHSLGDFAPLASAEESVLQ